MNKKIISLTLCLVLVCAQCVPGTLASAELPEASPVPEMSLIPEESPTPSAAPIPEETPTATPIPAEMPAATPIPEETPTATPIPEETPTVTPAPEETPTPTPAPVCTCGVDEAVPLHAFSCPLYSAAARPQCSCLFPPLEGNAHEEGCALMAYRAVYDLAMSATSPEKLARLLLWLDKDENGAYVNSGFVAFVEALGAGKLEELYAHLTDYNKLPLYIDCSLVGGADMDYSFSFHVMLDDADFEGEYTVISGGEKSSRIAEKGLVQLKSGERGVIKASEGQMYSVQALMPTLAGICPPYYNSAEHDWDFAMKNPVLALDSQGLAVTNIVSVSFVRQFNICVENSGAVAGVYVLRDASGAALARFAVPASGSVLIKNIPLGTYSVADELDAASAQVLTPDSFASGAAHLVFAACMPSAGGLSDCAYGAA